MGISVNEHVLQETCRLAGIGRGHGCGSLGAQEGVEGKFREIGQGDARQGNAAQEVENGMPSGGIHRHGCDRLA